MIPLNHISNLINRLSNNEDTRQDLWVYYLSGTPVESLDTLLVKIEAENSFEVELQEAIWNLIENPPSEELSTIIETNFSEYERSIIFCLMLGLNSSKISNLKGISQVRIKQSIATIRYNTCWEEAYGTKEKSDRRRTIRS